MRNQRHGRHEKSPSLISAMRSLKTGKTLVRVTEARTAMAARVFSVAVLAVGAIGCARVPSQAVVLSRTVGQRLVDLQGSHEAFVRAYFQVTRQRLNDFLVNQWTPTFLGNFVETSDLMNRLENVQPLTEEQKARLLASLQAASISSAD